MKNIKVVIPHCTKIPNNYPRYSLFDQPLKSTNFAINKKDNSTKI